MNIVSVPLFLSRTHEIYKHKVHATLHGTFTYFGKQQNPNVMMKVQDFKTDLLRVQE